MKVESGIYAPKKIVTVGATTDEFYSRRNDSGDRITFLWGAVTLTDY
jgi:hypothetical protein